VSRTPAPSLARSPRTSLSTPRRSSAIILTPYIGAAAEVVKT
jgi:hypothetical protein